MNINEARLSDSMSLLRRVSSPMTDEDSERVQVYIDAIELELDRIKQDRNLK